MQVEVLAFVSCRPELLAATFVMLTVLCLQTFQRDGRICWIVYGCVALVMGILSKEHALMVIPALCLPIFGHPETSRRRFLIWLSISALIVLGLRTLRMAGSPSRGADIIDGLLRALNLLGFYLQQLVVVERRAAMSVHVSQIVQLEPSDMARHRHDCEHRICVPNP